MGRPATQLRQDILKLRPGHELRASRPITPIALDALLRRVARKTGYKYLVATNDYLIRCEKPA
jgi:rRNA-processing protein FCF1